MQSRVHLTALIIAVAALVIAIISLVHVEVRKSVVSCHWEVPLKANYEVCSDGKVRQF